MDRTGQVLIVDDDAMSLRLQAGLLERQGHAVAGVTTVDQAVAAIDQRRPDVILLDWHLGEADGIDLIPVLRELAPSAAVILVTVDSSVSIAVRAVRAGAFDFLPKPIDAPRMLTMVDRAIAFCRLTDCVACLPGGMGDVWFEGMIGMSPAIRAVFEKAEHAAKRDAPVLIRGETGTGRAQVARAVHHLSRRSSAPFVTVDIAATPAPRLVEVLFGKPSDNTSAAPMKPAGACGQAAGGVLFLQAVDRLSPAMKPAVQRLAAQGVMCAAGVEAERVIDLRVVASAGPPSTAPDTPISDDLLRWPGVTTIDVPPLRERGQDIVLLAHHALRAGASRFGKRFETIDDQALAALARYPWPGNVRQLIEVMNWVVTRYDDTIVDRSMLPFRVTAMRSDPAAPPKDALGRTPHADRSAAW